MKYLLLITTIVVLCSCTTQKKQQQDTIQQDIEKQKLSDDHHNDKEDKEEMSAQDKQFSQDVDWILNHTLKNGFNPNAKKLDPNKKVEDREQADEKD